LGAEQIDDLEGQEISVGAVVRRLWRKRGVIVAATALALMIGTAVVATMYWRGGGSIVYYVSLQSISDGSYPNGTRFSPEDLVGSAIIQKLGEDFRLKSNDLRENIAIGYDNPASAGVSQKYRDRLSARNLTQADIDALNQAYQAELANTTRRGLRIDVDYRGLGVGQNVGAAIAVAVPQVWKEIYTKQYRILTDTKLTSAGITLSEENLDTTSSLLVASTRLNTIKRGLEIIGTDNRLASLVTSGGISAEDLNEQLSRFRTVYFNLLFVNGVTGNDAMSRAYMRDLELQIADFERRVSGLDRSIDDIARLQKSPDGTTSSGTNGSPPLTGDRIEISETSLGQIVGLAERASFAGYVQKLLNDRQELVERISGLRQTLAWVAPDQGVVAPAGLREQAVTELATLTKSYQDLLVLARDRSLDRAGVLYSELTTPETVGSIGPLGALLVLAIFGLIGFLSAIVYALVEPVVRNRRATAG